MSENKIIFTEHQYFRQWWLIIILGVLNLLVLYGSVQQIVFGLPFGKNTMSNSGLITLMIFTIIFTLLLLSAHLHTKLDSSGIYIRFSPFQRKPKFYPWNIIDKVYIRQYNPIAEYGGWGLRFGWSGKGAAWNVSGNIGLQIEFKDKSKLLVGTQKPQELEKALADLNF